MDGIEQIKSSGPHCALDKNFEIVYVVFPTINYSAIYIVKKPTENIFQNEAFHW